MTRTQHVQLGLIMIAAGVLLTVLTHNAGQGVIFYGLIVVGAFRIFRAMAD